MRWAGVLIALAIMVSPAIAAFHGVVSSGDPTSTVLPAYNDSYLNWKMAGLQSVGGIPSRSTQCGSTISPTGKTPPASGDDAAVINAAITACASGDVVQLASGTFNLGQLETIDLSNSITLRGSGACDNASSPYCATVIQFPKGALPYVAGGACGTTAPGAACPTGGVGSVVYMGPAGAFPFDFGWANGCGPNGSPATPGNCGAVAIAADVAQGATTVRVSATTHFSVGMWVLIDEASAGAYVADPVAGGQGNIWATSDWLSSTGGPATGRFAWSKFSTGAGDFNTGQTPATADSPGCWYSICDRGTSEVHKIASIGSGPCPGSNCTLTFDSPLTVAFRQSASHNAQVYYPTNQSGSTPLPFLQNAGLENVTILRAFSPAVAIHYCAYCWTKNVEVANWNNLGIQIAYSARVQIDSTYVHTCYNSDFNAGGVEYPIDITYASTEIYVVNSITTLCGKGMTARTGGAGSVVAYNYMDMTYYLDDSNGPEWVEMSVNGSHGYASHEMLFEGNWGVNGDNDHTHGTMVYHTYFRNDLAGIRSTFVDPSNSVTINDAANLPGGNGPLRAAGPMSGNYWFAYVGNVLGTAGVSTTGNGWTYSCSYSSGGNCIWLGPGWDDTSGDSDPHLTASSGAYLLRTGNYDYVNASVVWDASTPSHALPNSFYMTSQPSFFGASGANCSYPWPWVTPTAGTVLQAPTGGSCASTDGLPAKARFDAGTPFVQP